MKSGGRVMIKKICRLISCLPLSACILFLCSLTASNSFALDPPHNISNNITCATNCHQTAAAWKTWPTGTPTIDNTYANNLCKFCHLPGGNGYTMTEKSLDAQTHSSVKTMSTTDGTWPVQCRPCHNPHYQIQLSAYPTSTLNSVVTGTVQSVDSANKLTLQVSSAVTASAYAGHILIPDLANPFIIYQIKDNTAGLTPQITVDIKDPLYTYYVRQGPAFPIRYNGLIKDQITTPSKGPRPVRLFDKQGPLRSFATDTAVIDGVCQVCHTKTRYFTYDGTKLDQGHPAAAGTYCTECHK